MVFWYSHRYSVLPHNTYGSGPGMKRIHSTGQSDSHMNHGLLSGRKDHRSCVMICEGCLLGQVLRSSDLKGPLTAVSVKGHWHQQMENASFARISQFHSTEAWCTPYYGVRIRCTACDS